METAFEIAYWNSFDVFQLELLDRTLRRIVHAQHHQREITGKMRLQRAIKRERPRQVIRIEQGAEQTCSRHLDCHAPGGTMCGMSPPSSWISRALRQRSAVVG